MKLPFTLILITLITLASAGDNCKPDLNTVDKITKQGNVAWEQVVYETGFGSGLINTSSFRVTVQLGRYTSNNLLTVFLLKSEESAQNAAFESQYKGETGKEIYFAFTQGDPLVFKITDASNVSKMDPLFGKLMTTVTLSVALNANQIQQIKKAFNNGTLNAFRLYLANGLTYEKDIKDKRGEKLGEKVNCFLAYNEQNPVKEAAAPVVPGAENTPDDLPRDASTHKVSFTEVVAVDGATKDVLYTRAKNWMTDYFKNDKLSIDNKADGKLTKNGSFTKTYAYPGLKSESDDHLFNLSILLKDGKYKYELTDIVMDDGKSKMSLEQGYDMLSKSTKVPSNYKKYCDQVIYSGVQEVLQNLKASMKTDSKKSDW